MEESGMETKREETVEAAGNHHQEDNVQKGGFICLLIPATLLGC